MAGPAQSFHSKPYAEPANYKNSLCFSRNISKLKKTLYVSILLYLPSFLSWEVFEPAYNGN